MLKKTICLFFLILFITSCAENWNSLKRGLTGAKEDSSDEFLVEKKDPLIMPPDFEFLPTPQEGGDIMQETYDFEKALTTSTSLDEDVSASSSSTEDSIIQKIRNK